MEIFVKEKFESLRDEWSNVLCYHDPQSAWLMFSMCLSRSISHMCRQRPPSIILKYAHTFDDNMRRAVRRIFKVQLSDTEWRRLKLPCNEGGCNIFDIYKVAIAGYVASYEECFKHTADLFPVLNDLRSCNNDSDDRLSRSIREFNFYRTQLTGMANELAMLHLSPERMHKTTIPL
jgi:hypothetical protein